MTGDGGAADGLAQGERWDGNYKRQEESCWLAHKNLSKQSREARVSLESGKGSVTENEDFCPQCCGQSPTSSPRGHGLPLCFAPRLQLPLHQGLSALSSALLSAALRHARVIPATALPVPATSQQVWDKDVTLVLASYMGQGWTGWR